METQTNIHVRTSVLNVKDYVKSSSKTHKNYTNHKFHLEKLILIVLLQIELQKGCHI